MASSHALRFCALAAGLSCLLVALSAAAQLPRALGSAAGLVPAPGLVPKAPSQSTPEETVQSGAGLVKRAKASLRELDRIRMQTGEEELESLYDRLPKERDELATRITAARRDVRESRRAFKLNDVRFDVSQDRKRIDAWAAQVERASKEVEAGKKRTLELLKFWERANKLAKETGAPREVSEQTELVIRDARHTQLALARPEAVIIPLQSNIDEMSSLIDSLLRDTEQEGPNLLHDAHVRDFSVFQSFAALGELEHLGAAVSGSVDYFWGVGKRFVSINRDRLAAHALFTLLICVGMLALRGQSRDWCGEERAGIVARRIVQHPVSGALLLSMVLAGAFYDELPATAAIARYAVTMGCALWLFPALLDAPLRRLSYALGAFLCFDLFRLLVNELAHLDRLLLTVELLIAAAVLAYLLRRGHWPKLPYSETWTGFQRAVVWIWFIGTGTGALAALTGYGDLAEIGGGGMLVSMYLAMIFAAAVEATSSLFWILTQPSWAQRLHFVANHRSLVVAKSSRVLTLVAFVLWGMYSLEYLTLDDAVAQAGRRVLDASLELGSLKLSLGLVVTLGLGVALAYYVARLVRFLSDEDVLARFEIGSSTRDLVSSTLFYVVLFIGFFSTLGAVGISFDKLTVLMGALGVGIGFGLQNVVQNLVAGLLLLFGGPIKVRDKIQLADLMGEVTSIGFRASTVRTYQGAEVIVPNAKLIGDQVINWTMSDQRRRVDLDIGVKYGTDPERVIALLLEVGRAHPKVFAEPPPIALFLRHGDSSLNFQLRAWVTFDDATPVLSDLTVAVNKRLVAEGIDMPFPQRDLHLASVAPEAALALFPRGSR